VSITHVVAGKLRKEIVVCAHLVEECVPGAWGTQRQETAVGRCERVYGRIVEFSVVSDECCFVEDDQVTGLSPYRLGTVRQCLDAGAVDKLQSGLEPSPGENVRAILGDERSDPVNLPLAPSSSSSLSTSANSRCIFVWTEELI